MVALFIILGFIFVIPDVLALMGLTSQPLMILEATRLHTLPLLNRLPPGGAYFVFGAICWIVAAFVAMGNQPNKR